MSHDKNGTLIAKGDRVIMEFEVSDVSPAADPNFCNVNLKSVIPMPGNGIHLNISAVSTKQVLLVDKAPQE